jgi:PPP family 3-phenylpropionic acid transporter
LLRRPRLAWLFGIGLLQQLGLAPYDALFATYLTRLSSATAAGAAVALGAAAEFVFLLAGGSLGKALGAERLLALACAGSALRWAGIAWLTTPALLVPLQALHALSFGAFYVASIQIVDAESPPDLRASAQGAFGALCFGVSAAAGLSLAGLVERAAGARAPFAVAAAASVLATIAALRLQALRTSFSA